MNAEQLLFYLFALGAIAGCTGVVASKNPVNSAISLVAAFFFLAGNYVLLHANFMAIVQILVYAGAIMVLFLFVLMLLNLDERELGQARMNLTKVMGAVAAAVIGVVVGISQLAHTESASSAVAAVDASFGTVPWFGETLLTTYLLPFELASVLLLVGIVGAVVVAKRRL